jgi:regulator of replication initiation timing
LPEQLPTCADSQLREIMKLGLAFIFFAALTQAKVPIEEKKTIDGLRGEIAKVREENARQKIENEELRKAIAKLRQADPMRQDDIVDAVKEIVDAKLAGYQKKERGGFHISKKEPSSGQNTKLSRKSSYLPGRQNMGWSRRR